MNCFSTPREKPASRATATRQVGARGGGGGGGTTAGTSTSNAATVGAARCSGVAHRATNRDDGSSDDAGHCVIQGYASHSDTSGGRQYGTTAATSTSNVAEVGAARCRGVAHRDAIRDDRSSISTLVGASSQDTGRDVAQPFTATRGE